MDISYKKTVVWNKKQREKHQDNLIMFKFKIKLIKYMEQTLKTSTNNRNENLNRYPTLKILLTENR